MLKCMQLTSNKICMCYLEEPNFSKKLCSIVKIDILQGNTHCTLYAHPKRVCVCVFFWLATPATTVVTKIHPLSCCLIRRKEPLTKIRWISEWIWCLHESTSWLEKFMINLHLEWDKIIVIVLIKMSANHIPYFHLIHYWKLGCITIGLCICLFLAF